MSDEPAQVETVHRTRCQRCGQEVLEAPTLGGVPVLMEIPEIHPRERCPACLSKRLLKERCWRCGTEIWEPDSKRYIGEDLDGVLGVGLSTSGYASVFICGTRDRFIGESIHRAHRCSSALAA